MSDRLISDSAHERLKREADRRGRTVQGEGSDPLEKLATKETEVQDWWERVDELRRSIGPVPGDSTQYIREDRDTDHGRDDSGYRT